MLNERTRHKTSICGTKDFIVKSSLCIAFVCYYRLRDIFAKICYLKGGGQINEHIYPFLNCHTVVYRVFRLDAEELKLLKTTTHSYPSSHIAHLSWICRAGPVSGAA